MDPDIVVSEKRRTRCTAGHEFEWDDANINAAPVRLSIDGVTFCIKCLAEKMKECGVGEMES